MRIHPLALVLLLAAAPLAAAAPPETVESAPAANADVARAEDRALDERPGLERHCLRETGTRIRLRGERRACAPFAGRVWTRDELDRTGEIDIANALRRLDVSIR